MSDSDDELADEVGALVVARDQLSKDEAAGQAFLKEWISFESVLVLFFGKIDACYRVELKKPIMTNFEVNLRALKRVVLARGTPAQFKEPHDFLVELGELRKVGCLSYSGHNVYHEKGGSRRFYKVYDDFCVPVDKLGSLAQRAQRLSDDIYKSYKAYRDFEMDLELLVLLHSQREHVSRKARQGADRAYEILCDVHCANMKLEGKLAAQFAMSKDTKFTDIQFKCPSTVCRTYDLMAACGSQVGSAVTELKEPLREVLQRIREKQRPSKSQPQQS
jgi:hypothetical protein